ncbi:hypothetical protein MEO94_30210 [Dolichospermum sp. ST_sed9]|jgi:hypothetical protein|nr:hypothetical protein [Dolichospermum sp. ST_sed9]
MSTVIHRNAGQCTPIKSSGGSSVEYYKIWDKALEAKKRSLEIFAWKYNTSFYLCSSSDIVEFEDRVEEIRDQIMEGRNTLSKEDLHIFQELLGQLDTFQLMGIARLIEPLLEIPSYSKDVANIIKILLQNSKSEVRYSALEAISFALGEVQIADELLTEAKNLLKNEKTTYVRKYLESL